MNTIRYISPKKTVMLFLPLFILLVAVLTACKDDTESKGELFFNIEGSPTGFNVGAEGSTSPNYIVRSNRSWKIVAQEEIDWVRAFPDEGEDDGIFRFIVEENQTFDPRTVNFAFVVEGMEQPVLFRIEQESNVPYIIIDKASEGVNIPASGGEVTIDINANVDWTYSLDGDGWIIDHNSTETQIKITAPENTGVLRSLTLLVTSPSYPSLSAQIIVTQSPGTVILEEDFNWLNYGNIIPYETGGETRYDLWTPEEKGRGWTSTLNPHSNDTPLYARPGFVKLGKTNYGGDLISPKLTGIEGTKNVKVTFKAAAYLSATGSVVDSRVLNIFILGAGTPSTDIIMVENVPNTRPQDQEGIVNDIWDPARAFSFTITGATSETQIRFLGKSFDLRGEVPNTNRIFIDDIKVELID